MAVFQHLHLTDYNTAEQLQRLAIILQCCVSQGSVNAQLMNGEPFECIKG